MISSKITVMGMGAMGSRMARRLLAAGHKVTVYNRSAVKLKTFQAEGFHVVMDPASAVQDADYVFCIVTDDGASKEVWLNPKHGAISFLKPGAVAVESSTISPSWAYRLAEEMEKRQCLFLEAPVVGSRPQAEAGQLIFLLGGPEERKLLVEPLLSLLGSQVISVSGQWGHAAIVKLIVNGLFAIQSLALAELTLLGEEYDINRVDLARMITNLAVFSPAAKNLMAQMVMESYAPQFPISLVQKDLGYLVNLITARDKPLLQHAYKEFISADAAGYGSLNISGVIRQQEKKQR